MEKSLSNTAESKKVKKSGTEYLIISIFLSLLAAYSALFILQLLYSAFIEKIRVFGLFIGLALGLGFFILFASGAYYSLFRYKKVRKNS